MTHSELIKHLEDQSQWWELKRQGAETLQEEARAEASITAYELVLELVEEMTL